MTAARSGTYDVLVCDVMMPGLRGTEICRVLRSESDLPIILLTALDAEVDRVVGLEIGADDYVTQLVDGELVSRIRALLRRREIDRAHSSESAMRRVGGLTMDFVRHKVEVDGRVVALTSSEFNLLTSDRRARPRLLAQPGDGASLAVAPHRRRSRLRRSHLESPAQDQAHADPHIRRGSSPCGGRLQVQRGLSGASARRSVSRSRSSPSSQRARQGALALLRSRGRGCARRAARARGAQTLVLGPPDELGDRALGEMEIRRDVVDGGAVARASASFTKSSSW